MNDAPHCHLVTYDKGYDPWAFTLMRKGFYKPLTGKWKDIVGPPVFTIHRLSEGIRISKFSLSSKYMDVVYSKKTKLSSKTYTEQTIYCNNSLSFLEDHPQIHKAINYKLIYFRKLTYIWHELLKFRTIFSYIISFKSCKS